MASLCFNYEGARRPRPTLPLFGGRYLGYQPYQAPVPFFQNVTREEPQYPGKTVTETATELKTEETADVNMEVNQSNSGDIDTIAGDNRDAVEPVKTIADEKKEKQEPVANISELIIDRLSTAETGLVTIKDKVDTAKIFFDDIIYKFESMMQIVEIIRSNEERRAGGVQISAVASKTSKDNIDELLELLQTPAMQSIIRQVLLSVMTKKSAPASTGKME